MEDFSFGRKQIKFWQETGEVIGNQKYSETYVSSSGGGGYVGNAGGYVNAPSVSSTAVTNHDFWIRTEEGEEKAIQLKHVDVPLRVGQKITLIAVAEKKSDEGWFTVLVNHNAKRHWFLHNYSNLSQSLKLGISKKKMFIIGMICSLLVYFYLISLTRQPEKAILGIVFISAIAITSCLKGYNKLRLKMAGKRLQIHLEKLAQQTY